MLYLHFENQFRILLVVVSRCFFSFTQVIYEIPKGALGCHKNRVGNVALKGLKL